MSERHRGGEPDRDVQELMKAYEHSLPDSRPREPRGQIRTPQGLATPVYCANCSKFSGYVYGDLSSFFYLCDDCDHHGTGLDLPIVDPDVVRAAGKGGE